MAKAFRALRDQRLGLDDTIVGRHLGYTIAEIIKDRPDYINWLMNNTSIQFHESVYDELFKQIATKEIRRITRDIWYAHADQDDWWDDVPF